MDEHRRASLCNNTHFEIKGVYKGRIICLCKSSGELLSLNPKSVAEMEKLAPRAWWLARGWRRMKTRTAQSIHWWQASADIVEMAAARGQIDLHTFEELMRQRALYRQAKWNAIAQGAKVATGQAG